MIGSGMETGAGGCGVAVGSVVLGGANVGSSVAVAVGVAVAGSAGVSVGTDVSVGVGGSVGWPVGVSATGTSPSFCAKTMDGFGSVISVNVKINTAADKIRYNGLDCLMGKSPVQAIKPMIIIDIDS